jgi:hypothetical protein
MKKLIFCLIVINLINCMKIEHSCNHTKNYYNGNRLEKFLKQIKDSPEPSKSKMILNNVCLNAKDCSKSSIHRLWSQKVDCKCKGKYNYKCNSDYCSLNKQTCDGLMKRKLIGIKKCRF